MSLNKLTSQAKPQPQLNPRIQSLVIDGNLSVGGSISSSGQSFIYANNNSALQTIPQNVITPVNILGQVVTQGTDLSYNSGTGILTANSNGIYHIDFGLPYTAFAGSGGNAEGFIVDTKTSKSLVFAGVNAQVGSDAGLTGSITLSLVAGQTLQISTFQSSGNNQTLGFLLGKNVFLSAYRVC